jgi:N-6 DNA Methylase
MIHYKDIIAKHGGDRASFFSFDDDDDQLHLLPYATLTAARGTNELSALAGVYEWQNGPLFMLVNGDALGSDPDALRRLRRLVAMRGDAPYLAVVQTGRLSVYCVGLDDNVPTAIDGEALLIPHIVNARPGFASKQRWISDVILKLLTDALDALVPLGIDTSDAISLVGRALFTRFLADRNLLGDEVIAMGSAGIASLFDTHESVSKISNWLDDTFNGDFLPLPEATIRGFPEAAFRPVGNIMHGAVGGQLEADWSEDWAKLDFAHIPVGVLSQAYEQYLGTHQKDRQKKEGSYYTPRHIADLMVHASFAALRRDGKAHTAKILDPAAGAGVFLITAFRELVRERWRHDGIKNRPGTDVLREILYNQVRGFDINDSALRFAALGLYLISIELDPAPKPVEKLKFRKKFEGKVLFNLTPDDTDRLGSLGGMVGTEHSGAYDLVIGNPPWSKAKVSDREEDLKNGAIPKTEWKSIKEFVLQKARNRLENEKADAPLPNEVLDLPFVWRAMDWAKPDAQIAFALHGRLLFQRGEGMDVAFRAILGSVYVTGIINGAEVRQSEVWPNVDAPFCLLFASNCKPPPGATFRFISPHLEGPLSKKGGWRIDTAHAESVAVADIQRHPETLKALYRGNRLDLDIFERMAGNGFPSLGEYWAGLEGHGGTSYRPKRSGNGFGKLRDSDEPKPGEGGLRGQSAAHLYEYRILERDQFGGVLLESSTFRYFRDLRMPRLHRCCDEAIYKGPLLLVRKSAAAGSKRFQVAISLSNLVFNESYYGYSAELHGMGEDLVKYLCLVVGSKFVLWHSLMTSGEFGVEREVVEKYVVQEVPLKPFERLSSSDLDQVKSLFNRIASEGTEANWQQIDDWVASLYGLTPEDVQVISDTLELNQPSARSQRAAQAPADDQSICQYSKRLLAELKPWAERYKRPLTVQSVQAPPLSPWQFVAISANATGTSAPQIDATFFRSIQGVADTLSSTEIIFRDEANDSLLVGRLNQARYWSISQARLVARRIIWEQVDFLSGKPAG